MNGTQPRRIGIMGGTFDPIHYGHLLIAQSAAEEFGLDQVLFLPTGKSPHKSEKQVSDPKLRCQMVEIAIKDNENFAISTIEAENRETNYTCLTLEKLHKIYENAKLFFIMGEDSLDDFSTWKNPKEICRQATILIAVRNDTGEGIQEKIKKTAEHYQGEMYVLHAPNFSVSSREIRERIKNGKSVRYMLPEQVDAFIRQNLLYIMRTMIL